MADNSVSLKDILEAAGVGVFATDIFIGKLPKKPNAVVSIMQTGGKPSNPLYLVDFPSLQVMVRGNPNGYVAAMAKAQEVKDALLGLPPQLVNGDKWSRVNMIGDINNLGFDDDNRVLFSLNFAVILEPAVGTYRT